MAKNEKTGARVATIASRILGATSIKPANIEIVVGFEGDKFLITWDDIRALAASALTQAPDKKRK